MLATVCGGPKQSKKTQACEGGGTRPFWNTSTDCKLDFFASDEAKEVLVEIFHLNTFASDDLIGSYKVDLRAVQAKMKQTGKARLKAWFDVDTGGSMLCTIHGAQ